MDSTCELGGLVCPSPLSASPASACVRHTDSFEVLSVASPSANKLALGVDEDVFIYSTSPAAIWLLKKGVANPDLVRTLTSLTGLAFNPRTGDLLTCATGTIAQYKDNGHATTPTTATVANAKQCALSQNGVLFVATTDGVFQWNSLAPTVAAASFGLSGVSVDDVAVVGAFVYALEYRSSGGRRVFQLQLSDGALVATHCCFSSATSIQVNNRGEIFVLSQIPSVTGMQVSMIDLDGVISSYASLPTLTGTGDGLIMPNGDFLIAHQSTGRVLRIPPPLPKPVLQTCMHWFDVSKFPSTVAASTSAVHFPVLLSGAPVGGSVTLSIVCDNANSYMLGYFNPPELIWASGDASMKVFSYQLTYEARQQATAYTCWFTIGTTTTTRGEREH